MNSKVLVTILTYNSAAVIAECLESLQKITYPVSDFKILIIDNASTDNTLEIIKKNFPEVEIITNDKNLGFAGGNNIGFDFAAQNGFNYIYLLNDDTEVSPDFLTKAVEAMRSDHQAASVQSKLLLHHDKSRINSIGNEIHYLGFGYAGGNGELDFEMDRREITYASGASVLYDMSKITEVGVFNSEFFMYHEDLDIGWRIWLAGYKNILEPKSVVYHKYQFLKSIKKFYFMERNRFLVVLQNYQLSTLVLLFPALVFIAISMFFYSFLAGWWKEEFKVYKYFLNKQNLVKLMATRKSVQAKRKVPDREVIRRFVGEINFQEKTGFFLKYLVNPVFGLYWKIIKVFIR